MKQTIPRLKIACETREDDPRGRTCLQRFSHSLDWCDACLRRKAKLLKEKKK